MTESKLAKTELWVTIAGIIAVAGTATLQSGVLASLPHAAAIIGIVVTVATYVAGRSWVKGKEAAARTPVNLSITTPTPPAAQPRHDDA